MSSHAVELFRANSVLIAEYHCCFRITFVHIVYTFLGDKCHSLIFAHEVTCVGNDDAVLAEIEWCITSKRPQAQNLGMTTRHPDR